MFSKCAKNITGKVSNQTDKSLRIGLISPYMGTNLGDTAIIESARIQLVRLFPHAEVLLIVLDCENVSNLHGLEAFPLAAVPIRDYFTPTHASMMNDSRQIPNITKEVSLYLRMRQVLKKISGHIPLALPIAKRIRNGLCAIPLEAHHLFQARRIVCNLDGLIIVGGGQFDDEYGGPWGHPYSMFKWSTLANSVHVPVFFVGVGVDDLHHPLSSWFLCNILAHARRVSLRDGGSLGILHGLNIQRELISCPDLAFGMSDIDGDVPFRPSPVSSHLTIGISPICFGLKDNWPTTHSNAFEHYWHEISLFAMSLLKATHSIRIFVTDGGDVELARVLYNQIVGAGLSGVDVQLFPLMKLRDHIAFMKTCDVVVASRLHGVLLGHVSGVPVLAISYRRKVGAHMEDMGQERFCLDFEKFTSSEARESLFSLINDHSRIVSTLRSRCTDKRMAVEQEFAALGAELAWTSRYEGVKS